MSVRVKNYNATTIITEAGDVIINFPGLSFTKIRVFNEKAVDIVLSFGTGADFIAKPGDNFLQDFECTGLITAKTVLGAGPSGEENLFVQLTR
jgi:hypothetical protein